MRQRLEAVSRQKDALHVQLMEEQERVRVSQRQQEAMIAELRNAELRAEYAPSPFSSPSPTSLSSPSPPPPLPSLIWHFGV